MGKAADYIESLNNSIKQTIKAHSPFRAKVHDILGSGVQITTYGSDTPLAEPYARLDGPALAPDDDVAVIMLGDRPFVLGKITTDNTNDDPDGEFNIPVVIQLTNDNAFIVRAADGSRTLRVDTNSPRHIYVENDAVISGHRASDEAQRFWIRASDGAASFQGAVAVNALTAQGNSTINGNLTVNSVNSMSVTAASLTPPYITHEVDSSPIVSSTTNVGTWYDQGDIPVTLPSGTWTVNVFSHGRLAHSVGGTMSYRVVISGTAGDAMTGGAAGTTGPFTATCSKTGQTGTITVKSQFMNGTSGTAYSGQASFFVVAVRTS